MLSFEDPEHLMKLMNFTPASGCLGNENFSSRHIVLGYLTATNVWWVNVILLCTCALGILSTLWVIGWIVSKMCDGTLRGLKGNQGLTIMLLICIILMYLTALSFLVSPDVRRLPYWCGIRGFLLPVSHAACYAIIMVQVMQIRSIASLGIGGELAFSNQWLTLMFIVGVQTAVSLQNLVINEGLLTPFSIDGATVCNTHVVPFLCSHTYVVFLLLITFSYAASVKVMIYDLKEATWLLLATGGNIIVWLVWMLCYFFFHQYETLIVCVAVIVNATIILAIIYSPKLYILYRLRKLVREGHSRASASSMATLTKIFDSTLASHGGHSAATLKKNLEACYAAKHPHYNELTLAISPTYESPLDVARQAPPLPKRNNENKKHRERPYEQVEAKALQKGPGVYNENIRSSLSCIKSGSLLSLSAEKDLNMKRKISTFPHSVIYIPGTNGVIPLSPELKTGLSESFT